MRVRTDAAGRFAIETLAPGRVPLVVRSPGLAPWKGTAAIEVGRTAHVVAECQLESVVHGIVRDAEGLPVPGVFLGHGGYADVASAQTRSGEDGTFRLEGLPGGLVELRASHEAKGRASTKLELIAGADTVWNPVLAAGRIVAGRVVDEDGGPLAGWRVGAVSPDQPGLHRSSAHTDATGAFRLENCPSDAPWIEVREPDSWTGEPALTVRDVPPGPAELVVRIPRSAIASATIEGRIAGADGRSLEGATVMLKVVGMRAAFVERADAATGRFRIGPVQPGAYQVRLEAPGQGLRTLPQFDLAVGERVDLGDVVLEPAGYVRIVLAEPSGSDPARWVRASVHASVHDQDGRPVATVEFAGREGRSDPLASGSYSIRVQCPDARADDMPVVVQSGQEAVVEIRLEPATARSLELGLPEGVRGQVALVVRDAAGRPAFEAELSRSEGRPLVAFVSGLRVGTDRAEASTPTGLAGELVFEITELASGAARLRLDLR